MHLCVLTILIFCVCKSFHW